MYVQSPSHVDFVSSQMLARLVMSRARWQLTFLPGFCNESDVQDDSWWLQLLLPVELGEVAVFQRTERLCEVIRLYNRS